MCRQRLYCGLEGMAVSVPVSLSNILSEIKDLLLNFIYWIQTNKLAYVIIASIIVTLSAVIVENFPSDKAKGDAKRVAARSGRDTRNVRPARLRPITRKTLFSSFLVAVVNFVIAVYFPPIDVNENHRAQKLLSDQTETASLPSAETTIPQPAEATTLQLIDPNKRFRLNDSQELSRIVRMVNDDLEADGHYIDPQELVGFIYLLNGDYSRIERSSLLGILTKFSNMDVDAANILRGYTTTDSFSPLTAAAEMFSDQKDYEMVSYWLDRRNRVYSDIYSKPSGDDIIENVNLYYTDLLRAFCFSEPITLPSGKLTRMSNTSHEAQMFILCGLASNTHMVAVPSYDAEFSDDVYLAPGERIEVALLRDMLGNLMSNRLNNILLDLEE